MTPSFIPAEYWPTAPRSGNDSPAALFRMQNVILRGESGRPYAEVYGGSFNIGEDIPTTNLTGTVGISDSSRIITGVGTAFTTELHFGQFLEAYKMGSGITVPLVVDHIIDDTHFEACRTPENSLAGATVARLPVMFEMGKMRGTLLRGNAVEGDLGTILAVGEGELRRNGGPLPGTSLIASRQPKLALFDPTGVSYTVFSLGLATPVSLAVANGPVGTKNMQGGVYSLRAAQARTATRGYGNPSPKAELTLVTGNVIRATLPAITDPGVDAWVFFGSLYTQGGGINGPWYRIDLPQTFVSIGPGAGEIPAAGGTFDIEYNDAEITANDLLTFDNDPPPDAEFVVLMTGIPIYVSCVGPGNTSPGPFIATATKRNIEAVPPTQYVSTSPPDPIIGSVVGVQGRLYLMCVNSLQIAMATQAEDPRLPAFVIRPFWKSGFRNPETLLHFGDNIVGMTTNGLARSISEGDPGTEEYNFATAVQEILNEIDTGHCLIKHDPRNNAIVLFHSGHSLNAQGWWTTRALLYGLSENKWVGDVLLSAVDGDRLVCSAASVDGQLYFLAGGRQADGNTTIRTYSWDDDRGGDPIPWMMCWQLTDSGDESRPKAVKSLRVTGKVTAGEVQIAEVSPGSTIDMATIESVATGSGAPLPDTMDVTQHDRIEVDIDNLAQWAPKVVGVWPGHGRRDRIDEVVVDVIQRGARR